MNSLNVSLLLDFYRRCFTHTAESSRFYDRMVSSEDNSSTKIVPRVLNEIYIFHMNTHTMLSKVIASSLMPFGYAFFALSWNY